MKQVSHDVFAVAIRSNPEWRANPVEAIGRSVMQFTNGDDTKLMAQAIYVSGNKPTYWIKGDNA